MPDSDVSRRWLPTVFGQLCLALVSCAPAAPRPAAAPRSVVAPSLHAVPSEPVAAVPAEEIPRAIFFHGEEEGVLPPVPVETVRVFRGRPWIDERSPGTIAFTVDGGRAPMPDAWVERLRGEAASRGCNGIQIGFVQGAICDYFEVPDRIDGYCARCLVGAPE